MRRLQKLQTIQIDKTLPKKVLEKLDNKVWMEEHKKLHLNIEGKADVWICLLPWCIFRPNYGGNAQALKKELNNLTEKEMKILEAKS